MKLLLGTLFAGPEMVRYHKATLLPLALLPLTWLRFASPQYGYYNEADRGRDDDVLSPLPRIHPSQTY